MDFQCQHWITFDAIERERRKTIFPRLKINFNFSIQTEHSNYIQTQDSPHLSLESLDASNHTIAAAVTARVSLSRGDVRAKLEAAIRDGLPSDDRRRVIKRAWREVRGSLPGNNLPLFTNLYLDFKIRLTHSHVHVVVGDTCPRMVPPADSALAMLEKCGGEGKERW